MTHKKIKLTWTCFILGLVLGSYTAYHYFTTSGIVDVLSLSTDGRYVISADEKEFVVLWDLQNHTKKIINRKAHIWAAYFIPNTHNYIWQDQSFFLHIADTQGKKLKSINLPFFIDGMAMKSDLSYLIAGDISNGFHYCIENTCHTIAKPESDNPREYLADKPINLVLTFDEKFVLGSYFSVFMWDTITHRFITHYHGTAVQTFATISPDGKYVVAGDGNGGNIFVWDRVTGKQIYQAANLYGGLLDRHGSEDVNKWTDDSSKLIPVPQEFDDDHAGGTAESVKFIDNDHYLVFYQNSHYAVLFSVESPWPIKYLDLGKDPMPAMNYYERDQSMDTSPATHTLVMAKEHHGGILVYQYNPQDQTLTKVWDGK